MGGGGKNGGEGKTPDVFREDGRKLFLSTDAFRHPFCLQMLNLGILPGSLFSLKISCIFKTPSTPPSSGCILHMDDTLEV